MNHDANRPQRRRNARTAANRPGQPAASRNRKAAHAQRAVVGLERLEPRSMMAVTTEPLGPESIDGTGNNLAHPAWGSAGQDLLRLSPAAYGDGVSSPSGADRPSARLVSNLLSASPAGGVTNDRDMTAFVYVWGQFIDHDLGLTSSASPTERFAISVPAGDPSFDPSGTGTMTIPMSRSNWDAATGTGTATVRQQINSITAFIDGSNVYGSDATRAAALREFSGGRLRTSAGNLMPFNVGGLANANDSHLLPDSRLFLAGDVRANENPELVALQTLFVREHNRIAADAAAKNPALTDEQLYQHARRMVVAELQKITYDEFLPALLGRDTPAARTLHDYAGYNPAVNPGIATEFSTAAFRLGHSLLNEDIQFLGNDGTPVRDGMRLKDSFFDPRSVQEVGIDPLLKYSASDRTQEIDTKVVDDLRNFLFGQPGQGGFDLAALNIQRGRDHGLADYNTVRVAYGLPRVTSFAEITPDTAVQSALRQAYGTVDTIDLWVGGLAEKHLPNSSVGQTFTAIMVDQFKRLQSGDRYWYQNVLPASAVTAIQRTTLADVIRRNTQLTNLQPDVFVLHTSIVGTVFVDGNRDGVRQQMEGGIAGASVSLVTAAGVTVASTRTDARGDYAFRGMDLGGFSVVVTPPAPDGQSPPSVASRAVTISRGMEVKLSVGLPPKPATGAPGPTTPKPAGRQPGSPLPTLSPNAAVFAGIGAGTPGGTTVAPGARKR